MPLSRAIAAHTERGGSWMLPEAKGGDLLYVSTDNDGVYVFEYPSGIIAGNLNVFFSPEGLCSDSVGNVFITDFVGHDIVEYAHGGDKPIKRLTDGSAFSPTDCAVDATTGNLAATQGDSSGVLIFRKAKGHPQEFFNSGGIMENCTYDPKGNLFTNNFYRHHTPLIGELPRGSSSFKNLKVDKFIKPLSGMRWDGKYLAVGGLFGDTVYQVHVSSAAATIVGTTHLYGTKYVEWFWTAKDRVINADVASGVIGICDYPGGGSPLRTIEYVAAPHAVTLSLVSH